MLLGFGLFPRITTPNSIRYSFSERLLPAGKEGGYGAQARKPPRATGLFSISVTPQPPGEMSSPNSERKKKKKKRTNQTALNVHNQVMSVCISDALRPAHNPPST